MSRAVETKHHTNFLNGLVDSGNEFNAPDNALKEALNVELTKEGLLKTRAVVVPETGSWVTRSFGFGGVTDFPSYHTWEGAGEPLQIYSLVGIGISNITHFYEKNVFNPITSEYLGSVTLTSSPGGTVSPTVSVEGNGRLFMTSGQCFPAIVSATGGGPSVSKADLNPQIRDFEGADDGYATDYQPLAQSISGTYSNPVAVGDELEGLTSGFKARALLADTVGPIAFMPTFNLKDTSDGYFVTGEQVRNNNTGLIYCTITDPFPGNEAGLTKAHYYNLLNQGWTPEHVETYARYLNGPLSLLNLYPSNAQVWTAGKDASGAFSPAELVKVDFGTTRAPQGHFVLDVFNQIRQVTNPVTNATESVSSYLLKGGFNSISFYAGRLWLLGGTDSDINNKALFSRDLTGTSYTPGADNCYFEDFHPIHDLTSEYLNDTLPTDGGVVTIQDAGQIRASAVLGNKLILLCSNGVWAIGGSGTGEGFTAQSVSVDKISDNGITSIMSLVETGDTLFYLGKDGFYRISPDEYGRLSGANISRGRIDNLLDTIAGEPVGSYDEVNHRVVWFYGKDGETPSPGSARTAMRRALYLDIATNSFLPQSFVAGSDIAGANPGYWSPLAIVEREGQAVLAVIKREYTTTYDWYSSFAVLTDNKTYDWDEAVDGEFEAYFETWPEHLGNPMLLKQAEEFRAYFRRTETEWVDDGAGNPVLDYPSSCLVEARWDWSDEYGNMWSDPQQAYTLYNGQISDGIGSPVKNGVTVISESLEIAGEGRSVSFRFTKEDGYVFEFLGFSVNYSAGSRPA